MMTTMDLVDDLQAAGEDFEWYPTTDRMIDRIARSIAKWNEHPASLLDVGAGDGRVLTRLAAALHDPKLYGIEKSPTLLQAQPEAVTPVGTEFFEQDLMSLPVDVLFCNPPYSQFEAWAARIIETAFACRAYLVLPRRWKDSPEIAAALAKRQAKARVILEDDFLNAERRARAVVDVVKITFDTERGGRWHHRHDSKPDPFDLWFDQNIDTFEHAAGEDDTRQDDRRMARIHRLGSIASLVEAYDEEYARMQENYKAIFRLDHELLRELGVNKVGVRDGLKKRMAGLKSVYWEALFDKLDAITSRLTTATKDHFRRRIAEQTSVAFTTSNAYTVALWAIKFANHYFDDQVVKLFRDLSTHDGVTNYVSNTRTWQQDRWRYADEEKFSHYSLDYRIVLHGYQAINAEGEWRSYEYPGGLSRARHELIDDMIAVFGNLGFTLAPLRQAAFDGSAHFASRTLASRARTWKAGEWQDFITASGETLFQVKGYLNGNVHVRFLPAAIKALNIEAGRLLGWLRGPADVVAEMGYSAEDAARYFGSNHRLAASSVRLLTA